MELKVWVDGIQRVICGVSETTTCQDIVLALAHATGRTGRFTLIEKWRSNERPLAPDEQPLQVLQKWGEYATDVQFMLIQTDKDGLKSPSRTKLPSHEKKDRFSHNFTPPQHGDSSIKRSFTFSGAHSGNSFTSPARKREKFREVFHESSISEESEIGSSPRASKVSSSSKPSVTSRSLNHKLPSANSSSNHTLDPQSPYNSLERNKRRKSPHRPPAVKTHSGSNSQVVRSNGRPIPKPRNRVSASTSNGPKSLDTYLSQNSPPDFQEAWSSSPLPEFEEYDLDKNFPLSSPGAPGGRGAQSKADSNSSSDESQEYSSLVKLVTLQQERLQTQESQINIIESEIKSLEEKGRVDEERLKELEVEIQTWESKCGDTEQELIDIDSARWQDQLEAEEQSEQNLKSQTHSIQTKITDCEKQIAEMISKKDSIIKEIEIERKTISAREKKERDDELLVVKEVADIQKQINEKLVQHKDEQLKLEELSKELNDLDSAIMEKKLQVAELESSLKEANLQQFVITPPTTPTNVEDGESALFKQLSRPPTRKPSVSPQDFSSTVATSEHPDGVWV